MTAPGYTFVGYRIVDGKMIPMVEPVGAETKRKASFGDDHEFAATTELAPTDDLFAPRRG